VAINLHRLAEERSIAMHGSIASKLRDQPTLLDRARERVRGWLADGSVARPYAEAWDALLARPLDQIETALIDPGEPARALRQCTPFAGALDPRERWRIRREVRARLGPP
jgi:hypothetical protein